MDELYKLKEREKAYKGLIKRNEGNVADATKRIESYSEALRATTERIKEVEGGEDA
jgi:septation ring formation regulator EzrA